MGSKVIFQQLKNAGADVDGILGDFGLTRKRFLKEDTRIPYEKYGRLLERCAEELDDDLFGLRMAQLSDPRDLGPIAYVGLASRTLHDAIRNLSRYSRVVNEAYKMELMDSVNVVSVMSEPARRSFDQFRQAGEFCDAIFVEVYQEIIGKKLVPVEMRFAHSFDGDPSGHEALLGCPVSFNNSCNEIILSRDLLSIPVKSADYRLLRILTGFCDDVLKDHATDGSDLVSRFERILLDLLPVGRARVDIVAAELGMSRRTLARRLADMKTSFNLLLDKLRHELALKYIRRPELQLSEVAFLLGYSNQSSFSVAFKRWTGKTPKSLRAT